ncbi:MerR family transcriptional regulator [Cellulosimicrobium sp. Marseille-Q8652]
MTSGTAAHDRLDHPGRGPGDRTVGETAALVGVTVRALHHWDAIGLARPSARTSAGYRLYTASDVARLRRVVAYRELGIALEVVPRLLDAPADDAVAALRRERALLDDRIASMERTAAALDRLVEARERGLLLTPVEQVAIFGESWQPSWPGEARERWGETAQWAQHAERSAERTPDDWRRIAAEVSALEDDLSAACRAGVAAGSTRADALAERHRASIGAYFDCTLAMHVCLGRTYTDDPGFRAHYDALAPGLAGWLRAAVEANARAQGVDPDSATWG